MSARETEPRPGPEQRLESLRFFVAQGPVAPSKSMLDWMQEVEKQLANLRERLNDLPSEFARKGPVW